MLKEVATSRDINDLGRSGQAKNIKKDDKRRFDKISQRKNQIQPSRSSAPL